MFRTISPLPYNLCSTSLVQALNMEGKCQSSICHLTMTSSSCLLTLLNLCQDFMIRSVSLYSYNLASRYLLLLYVKISSNLKCSCMSMSSSIYPVFLWNFSFSWFIPIMQICHSLIKKITFKSTSQDLLNQIKPNLAGMVFGRSIFKIVANNPTLHSKWPLLRRIEISSILKTKSSEIV